MASKRELTLEGILPHLRRDDEGWRIAYQGVTLRSVFQPIISITHKRVVGYEALLRPTDAAGRPIPPDELFSRAPSMGDALALERLARCVHFANFAEQNVEKSWLFVNALPRLFRTGWPYRPFIDELCDHFGLPPQRIVIEMIEQPASDEALFERTIDTLRERGLLIAIDDFGTGFSNFDRIWRVRPDIVKLDRSLVWRMATAGNDHQFATELVTMLHRAGTMVLGEGVESENELLTMMEADVDFLQGYWLGLPHASITQASAAAPALIESIWERFHARESTAPRAPVTYASFEEAVLIGSRIYQTTGDLALAARQTFKMPHVRRVFVVDARGNQTQPSVALSPNAEPLRLAPLFPDTDSNWSRRAYFKRALASPGRVAVMGPHYSLTEGKDCYTAAVTVQSDKALDVFCVDFVLDAS
ncbi:sensor domain-containing phosphodiesterase [Trinickia fusca]|uniref:EAL domain-containing protein n=1 Tax=Trinickia fusca TaxID=2419777 RepID=A0A494XQ77_9BURK|nr:EAL domain-containing protein [Trinickia fusca]RKP52787.1 EAL domain-containing protein [Trinickia fusca]